MYKKRNAQSTFLENPQMILSFLKKQKHGYPTDTRSDKAFKSTVVNHLCMEGHSRNYAYLYFKVKNSIFHTQNSSPWALFKITLKLNSISKFAPDQVIFKWLSAILIKRYQPFRFN